MTTTRSPQLHRKMAVGEETEARAGSPTPEVKVTRCSGDRLLTNPDELSELQNVIKVIRSRAAPLSSCLLPCSSAPLALRASSLLSAPPAAAKACPACLGAAPTAPPLTPQHGLTRPVSSFFKISFVEEPSAQTQMNQT